MDDRRTDTARDHDDSDIIDNATGAPSGSGASGASGGNLQRDVATQSERDRVRDPEGMERVTKEDDIANNDAYPNQRPRD